MWGSSLLATHLSYRRAVPGALVTLSQPPSPVVIVAADRIPCIDSSCSVIITVRTHMQPVVRAFLYGTSRPNANGTDVLRPLLGAP